MTIQGLPEAAKIAGRALDVVVECDTGRKRAGVETPGEAIELARMIAAAPGLAFAGFMFYPPDKGMAGSQAFLNEAVAGARASGSIPALFPPEARPTWRSSNVSTA